MPNIGHVLKEEIARVCRKEIRRVAVPLRKASAAHRRDLAAIKRTLRELERLAASLARRASATRSAQDPTDGNASIRFSAKGLRSLRAKLGLSAAEFAQLVGVGGQSVYNWEGKKATPRRKQLAKIAALRSAGKRQVRARLTELVQGSKRPRRIR